jgi:KDO2-lipid IV(A) lauroyltransferase
MLPHHNNNFYYTVLIMKAPEQYDPSNPSKTDMPPPTGKHNKQSEMVKSPAIPAGMPTITQTHKQTAQAEKKPFQWQFLLPQVLGHLAVIGNYHADDISAAALAVLVGS